MTREQIDIIKLVLKVGVVATAVSIPLGLWAIPKWPDQPIIPTLILTGATFVVKQVMVAHAGKEEPLLTELHQPALANCCCG
jgi:hypothetical protein